MATSMDSQSFMEVSYHSSDYGDTEEDGEILFEEVEEGESSDDSSSYKSSGYEVEEEDDEEEEEKQEEQPNDVGNASAPVKAKAPVPLHQLLANKLKNTPVKLSNKRSSNVRSVKEMAAAFNAPGPTSYKRPELKTGSLAVARKFPSENSSEQQPDKKKSPQRAPDKTSPSVETPKLSPLKSTQPPPQQHQQKPAKKPVDNSGPNKISPSAENLASSSQLNSPRQQQKNKLQLSPQQQSKTKLRQGGDPNTPQSPTKSQTRGKGIDSKGNKSRPEMRTKTEAELQSEMEILSEASSASTSEWTASSGPSTELSQTNSSPEFKNVGDPSPKAKYSTSGKNLGSSPKMNRKSSIKRTSDHSYDESSFGFSLSSGTDESLAAKIGDLGTPFAPYPISDDHDGYDGTMSLQSTSNSRRNTSRGSEGMPFERQVSWSDFGEGSKHGRKSITDNSDSKNDGDDESISYESYETASSEEFETDTEDLHSKSLSPPGRKSSDLQEEESAVSSDYETDTTYERKYAAIEGRTPPAPRRLSKAIPLPSGPLRPNLGPMQIVEESENGESSGTSNSFRQSQNSGLDTSTGAISGKKSNENDIYASGTPVDVIEPERRGRRRKPFEDVPTAVEAELKNIPKNNPRLRDDDSTPLGIIGWDGQGEPSDREKNENGKGRKRSLLNQLFRKKSNDDEEEEKRNDEIPSSPIPIPPSPPPYNPPDYDNDDDELSNITDRVFFPKRPNPFQNPDPIQEKPSSRGSLDGSGRFSITSFRRNNSIRNTERALEGMKATSMEPSYAESLPSEDRRKRDIGRALAGRSKKLRHRLANLPEESPISQYMQNDTADMRFPYDYGSSAQLSSNYHDMSQSSGRSFDLPSSHDIETQGIESELYESPNITEEVIEEVFVGYDDEDGGDSRFETHSNEEEDARDGDISHKTEEETKNRKSRRLSFICCIVTFNLLLLLGIGTWLLLEYFIFDENIVPPIDPSDGSPSALSPIKPDSSIEEKKAGLSTILKPNLSDGGKALDDNTSPQADALDWLSKDTLIHTYDEQKIFTRFTLATFYYSTDGDNWTTNHLWLTDLDECLWYTSSFENPCTERRFSRLVITDNNLQGSIPQELSLLSNSLVNLDVDGTFTGSIPFNIGDLAQLTSLRLSGRVLSGKIPDSLYTLSNLSALDLGRNVLSGRLSTAIGSLSPSLNAISFMANHLTGPVPEEVGQLTGLTYFNIDDNYFDFISEDAISRLSKLETLSARNNVLKGNLPFIDGNSLTNLRALFLNNNELTGSIPDSYGSLSKLEGGLDLSSNRLVGRVPESMGQLSMLRHLLLRDNPLSGTIPLSWGKLSILDTLRLDSTNFEGELPTELCDSFDEASSSFYADCWKLDCPCCNFCCDSETGECVCRFEDSLPILCVAP